MNRTKWLTCRVSPGQFSDELGVRGHDHQNKEFSLFTSRRFVRCEKLPAAGEEVPGSLQAVVLDQQGTLCLIRLPGQTFDNGSTITVRSDQLEDSQAHQFA